MIRICFISDTHNNHKKLLLPDADIIVHAGDMTSMGKEHEIRNFFKWYSKLNYKHKICVAGNHDMLFDTSGFHARSLVPHNVKYLEDSGITLMGYNFYGSPVQSPFFNWGFMKPESKLKQHWEAIPDDVDVLITHAPAYGILDSMLIKDDKLGSPSLTEEILNRVKPLVHVCGHIHSGHGYKVVNNTTFINASILNEEYEVHYNPILLEINDKREVTLLKV